MELHADTINQPMNPIRQEIRDNVTTSLINNFSTTSPNYEFLSPIPTEILMRTCQSQGNSDLIYGSVPTGQPAEQTIRYAD